ncbi:MAG: TlpA family protein disulfide reductase [Bacteroidetes bacterium]|nr:MAG: TlpA family protein disulfide reductase [Bacteroidota bacterium]
MKNFKTFTILLFISFVLVSNTACTQEKANEESMKMSMNNGENPHTMLASNASGADNATTVGKVHKIESVGKAKQGYAVEFTWKGEDGNAVRFSDYTKGKVVLLNFWGTWCPPCRREIPDLVEVSKDMANKDFILIGVATGERGGSLEQNIQIVSNFMKDKGIPYNNFIATQDLVNAYGGIAAVPTTYIIDKNGKISESIVGMRTKSDFMESINRVLK